MQATLQHHLVAPTGKPYLVRECRIANRRRRDGASGTIEYDVRLEDPTTGHSWDEKVTGITYGGGRTRRVWESIRRSARSDADPAPPLTLPPFAYVPELDLLLQVFPHDHRLPALARLIAAPPPEFVPALLAAFGAGNWELTRWDAATVQYRVDMRVILRLTVGATNRSTDQTAERQFYAKIYRDAAEGRRAFLAQSDLHQRASAVGADVIVPKPVIYAEELRTLVIDDFPGRSLSEIIERGKGSIDAVKSAARAVAEFHQLDVVAPPRPLAEDLARLHQAEETIVAARPDLAEEVRGMVHIIAEGLAGAPTAPIHGDLKPEHLLIDGTRVALIDFDLCGAADPVIDVAHFLGFLHESRDHSRSDGEEREDLGQVFVDEYFTHAPDSGRARIPLHHAMTSIHKAAGLCRRPGAKKQKRVEDVLREGKMFLERGADGSLPSFKRRLTRSAVR